jgi:uncharacterized phage protein (TIGR02220 family)
MATTPYFKFFIGDYLADTTHLSTEEHGAYLLLILAYYRNGGPLPNDERRLSNIIKSSLKGFRRMRLTLSQFFTITETFWKHKRIDSELDSYRNKSSNCKASAEKRWENKEEEKVCDRIDFACVSHTQSQCEIDAISEVRSHKSEITNHKSQITNQKNILSGKPDVALQKNEELKKQAEEILKFLNEKTKHKYRFVDTNLKKIIARLKSGATVEDCMAIIVRKFDEWGNDKDMKKYLCPSTLFGAEKFEKYIGQLFHFEDSEDA